MRHLFVKTIVSRIEKDHTIEAAAVFCKIVIRDRPIVVRIRTWKPLTYIIDNFLHMIDFVLASF